MSPAWPAIMARAVENLRAHGIDDPIRDARLLLAHALDIAPDRLTLHLDDTPDAAAVDRFNDLIAQRCDRVPVSHLRGRRMFWGRDFTVSAAVLDPRPETETLVAAALALPFTTVLDLGTGSGAILLSLLAERVDARGTGVDLSPEALAVARENAEILGLDGRAKFLQSDWFAEVSGSYDLIVANPPYIAAGEMAGLAPELAHEPRIALTDEGDGLGAYRTITAAAPAYLNQGGWLVVEIGHRQGPAVSDLFLQAGFRGVRVIQDMDRRDRVVQGRWRARAQTGGFTRIAL